MNLGERIKLIRGSVAREKFAPDTGISKTTLVNYETDANSPTAEYLNKLLELFPEISPSWLLAGEGLIKRGLVEYPLADSLKTADLSGDKTFKVLQQATPGGDTGIKLQVYVTGGAGDPFELIPTDPVKEIIIPKGFYSPSIIPVMISGRSMEKTLHDGAVVGVDREDRRVVNGELYAVWLPYQGTVIKRLYLDNKKILLQSDNEEFRSRDVEVNITDIDDSFIQGRVKWVVQAL